MPAIRVHATGDPEVMRFEDQPDPVAGQADIVVRIHAALVAGLANGSLRPVVGREFPLSEAPAAHVAAMQPGAYGKKVLVT